MKKALEVGCGKFAEWESLKREHKAYAFLAKGSIYFLLNNALRMQ